MPYWFFLGPSGSIFTDLTGPYLALLGLTGSYWVLLGLTGLYWALFGLTFAFVHYQMEERTFSFPGPY